MEVRWTPYLLYELIPSLVQSQKQYTTADIGLSNILRTQIFKLKSLNNVNYENKKNKLVSKGNGKT